jgi:hypothetical protein
MDLVVRGLEEPLEALSVWPLVEHHYLAGVRSVEAMSDKAVLLRLLEDPLHSIPGNLAFQAYACAGSGNDENF